MQRTLRAKPNVWMRKHLSFTMCVWSLSVDEDVKEGGGYRAAGTV